MPDEYMLVLRRIQMIYGAADASRLPGEGGCNPITNLAPSFSISVIPAKAGTQGFQSLPPGSPLSRGRRVELSAGFPDSLAGRDLWQRWAPAFAGVTEEEHHELRHRHPRRAR